jgi:hypothetical protein
MSKNSNHRRSISPRTAPAPAPAPVQIQQKSASIVNTIKEGLAFGAGSSIAHNVINSFFGGSSVSHQQNKGPTHFSKQETDVQEQYNQCIEDSRDTTIICEDLLKKIKYDFDTVSVNKSKFQ